MSVSSVLIGLQASRNDGLGVTAEDFLAPLNIRPDEVEATGATGGAWESAMVYFGIVRYRDFDHIDTSHDAGAQTEAFYAGIGEAFREVGRFLDGRQPDVTAAMRSSGLSLRLFIEVRMDQDQMELEFPPEFLAACGRHDLNIYLISNDISAAEVIAAREMDQP